MSRSTLGNHGKKIGHQQRGTENEKEFEVHIISFTNQQEPDHGGGGAHHACYVCIWGRGGKEKDLFSKNEHIPNQHTTFFGAFYFCRCAGSFAVFASQLSDQPPLAETPALASSSSCSLVLSTSRKEWKMKWKKWK